MEDYPELIKERARELAEDRGTRVQGTMAWAAVLLIAANAPIEERTELMEMARQVGPLSPYRRDPSLSESDQMACISEIETRFRKLCSHNSIAPEEPVPEEQREHVRQVLLEIKRARAPLELLISRLQKAMEETAESAVGANLVPAIDEWTRLGKECNRVMAASSKILFLGPDAVDTSEFQVE